MQILENVGQVVPLMIFFLSFILDGVWNADLSINSLLIVTHNLFIEYGLTR